MLGLQSHSSPIFCGLGLSGLDLVYSTTFRQNFVTLIGVFQVQNKNYVNF